VLDSCNLRYLAVDKASQQAQLLRFATFEVDLRAGELRKGGLKLKLSGQPFQVLTILLEHPGDVVTREEFQTRLWPDTFVDVDHNLNTAINKIREVLGDSAENPRFVETLPRRGYRFIASVAPESQVAINGRPWLRRHWKIVISGAGLLLLVCTATYLKRQPTKSRERLHVVPFTSYPGFEAAPSFSPDGNEIVFCWYHFGDLSTTLGADLYVKQFGNERAVRLTNREATFIVPAWSPDGRTIAFATIGKHGNGIYLVPALGGSERRISELGESLNGYQWLLLSWSADSRQLAFAKAESPAVGAYPRAERHHIHVVDVETNEERVLSDPSTDCATSIEPAFSPDGKYLAIDCVLAEDANRIYIQSTAGGEPHEVALIRGSGVLSGLAWTTNSQTILYSTGDIWRVPVTGGTPELLSFAHDAQTPTISRTGKKMAYAQTNYHPDVWRINLASQATPARPANRFIASTGGQLDARISPDGERIVFESGRSGFEEIWQCDRDGSNPIQLSFLNSPADRATTSPTSSGTPRWSPDGHHIVFDSRASGHAELYVVDADGGPPRRLTTGTSTALAPFWSADGRSIYFSTEQPAGVWKVSSAGGTAVRVTKGRGYYPQESADGQRVFYVAGANGNEIWSVAVNGGSERREEGMPVLSPGLGTAWTPVQNGIYFVDGTASNFSIVYFDLEARRLHRVCALPEVQFVWGGITVSKSGDTLLYAGVDHGESDIVLAEGFN
jgi:Tol biopolymer transport system component/DNA-binding winged helix-turn-helix (wHTH) protein